MNDDFLDANPLRFSSIFRVAKSQIITKSIWSIPLHLIIMMITGTLMFAITSFTVDLRARDKEFYEIICHPMILIIYVASIQATLNKFLIEFNQKSKFKDLIQQVFKSSMQTIVPIATIYVALALIILSLIVPTMLSRNILSVIIGITTSTIIITQLILRYGFASHFIVDQRVGILESLKLSHKITNRRLLYILGTYFISGIIVSILGYLSMYSLGLIINPLKSSAHNSLIIAIDIAKVLVSIFIISFISCLFASIQTALYTRLSETASYLDSSEDGSLFTMNLD